MLGTSEGPLHRPSNYRHEMKTKKTKTNHCSFPWSVVATISPCYCPPIYLNPMIIAQINYIIIPIFFPFLVNKTIGAGKNITMCRLIVEHSIHFFSSYALVNSGNALRRDRRDCSMTQIQIPFQKLFMRLARRVVARRNITIVNKANDRHL